MKRHAIITGRNRDRIFLGWQIKKDSRFAYPEPLVCASEAQAVVAEDKCTREGKQICRLPGERKVRARDDRISRGLSSTMMQNV